MERANSQEKEVVKGPGFPSVTGAGGGGEGGKGGTLQSFILGGSSPRSNPYPFV